MLSVLVLLASRAIVHADEVSFNRDIRPILSENCFACHGPDAKARKADLRLDVREDALRPAASGEAAIVPGDLKASELIARITATDLNEMMPPPKSHKKLTAAQIAMLKAWVAKGAAYQKHWAFEPLEKPRLPEGQPHANPIDVLVRAKLTERGMPLSPEAPPETLLRRVTLDLTGLPPTLDELRAFQADLQQPGATLDACYERVVDRLLQSKHFGEHLAVSWLDAARYADTNGYFGDRPRQMWLWRDWVIDAFNNNMPFDQFTIEQLAGDLLPNATVKQRVATGFNRNHMANNETGSIDEEFRTEYVVDRVDTTMTTWLGLTAGCAQCHDHKFDPISQREFYQLFSFFNNVPETGLILLDNPPPVLEVPSPEQEQQRRDLAMAVSETRKAYTAQQDSLLKSLADWEKTAVADLPSVPKAEPVFYETFNDQLASGSKAVGTALVFQDGIRGSAAKFDGTQHVEMPLKDFNPDVPWTIGAWMALPGDPSCLLSIIEPLGNCRGIEVTWERGRLHVKLQHHKESNYIEVSANGLEKQWHQVIVSYDGSRQAKGLSLFVDGKLATCDVLHDALDGDLKTSEPLRIGRGSSGQGFYGRLDEVRILKEVISAEQANDWFWADRIGGIIARPAEKRIRPDAEVLLDYYTDRFANETVKQARHRMQAATKAEIDLRLSIPTTLVMHELPEPRKTHVLERGQYDKPGEAVEPGVPPAVALWPEAAPKNRLGFAQWLVSPGNPLTPRVAVNRLWQHCFGEGLVRTVNDFGSQGEPPTHPELLDWLALTLRDSGWDVKRMLKTIVTSQTYRQSSKHSVADGQVIDPENRLLARGPSYRLSSEALRDQALAVSGLLVRKIGGPSVKPYQPAGLWEAVSFGGEDMYVADTGEGLWRRTLYSYIKRQAPPPELLTFDGPTREKCTVRRARTNTPLQALLMLNDETFVEAARVLAEQIFKAERDDESRLKSLWRRVLLRDADAEETAKLLGLLQRQRERFAKSPEAASKLIAVGVAPRDPQMDAREVAALAVVAQAIMNLDETVTKR